MVTTDVDDRPPAVPETANNDQPISVPFAGKVTSAIVANDEQIPDNLNENDDDEEGIVSRKRGFTAKGAINDDDDDDEEEPAPADEDDLFGEGENAELDEEAEGLAQSYVVRHRCMILPLLIM